MGQGDTDCVDDMSTVHLALDKQQTLILECVVQAL